MEGFPSTPEAQPNPFEKVKEYIGLTPEEDTLCKECTPDNKTALIAWYVREQDVARETPDNRAGIELDIKAGVMQYLIAKNREQRDEALERLWEAQNAALQEEGMSDLAAKAEKVSEMLCAV